MVFEDAEVAAAAAKAAKMYDDAGQVCLAGTRLIVHRDVADEFLEHFRAEVDARCSATPATPRRRSRR